MGKLASGKDIHAIFFAAAELQRIMAEVVDYVHQETGMVSSQRLVLRQLTKSGPATVPDLARERGVSRQFVQTVVNELLEANLVELQENPRHKRSKLVKITDAGHEAFGAACQRESDFLAGAFPDLEGADVEATLHVLGTLQKRTTELRDRLAKEK